VAGAVWTVLGLIARLPLEVVLAGTAVTQSLAVGQSILAKDEDLQERRQKDKEEKG